MSILGGRLTYEAFVLPKRNGQLSRSRFDTNNVLQVYGHCCNTSTLTHSFFGVYEIFHRVLATTTERYKYLYRGFYWAGLSSVAIIRSWCQTRSLAVLIRSSYLYQIAKEAYKNRARRFLFLYYVQLRGFCEYSRYVQNSSVRFVSQTTYWYTKSSKTSVVTWPVTTASIGLDVPLLNSSSSSRESG